MQNRFNQMADSEAWAILVSAAKRAVQGNGYTLKRVPGRGRSNVFVISKNGTSTRASIRTTRDRWIAFPPLDRGKKWKTLDGVVTVFVAAVDEKDDPQNVEVYEFPANELRQRFDAAYAARTAAGQAVPDDFGMWINLDRDQRGLPASTGSGIAAKYKPIATYPVESLTGAGTQSKNSSGATPSGNQDLNGTIGEVLLNARKKISELAGVDSSAIKLDLRIQY